MVPSIWSFRITTGNLKTLSHVVTEKFMLKKCVWKHIPNHNEILTSTLAFVTPYILQRQTWCSTDTFSPLPMQHILKCSKAKIGAAGIRLHESQNSAFPTGDYKVTKRLSGDFVTDRRLGLQSCQIRNDPALKSI